MTRAIRRQGGQKPGSKKTAGTARRHPRPFAPATRTSKLWKFEYFKVPMIGIQDNRIL
jgi:hypothetical protein